MEKRTHYTLDRRVPLFYNRECRNGTAHIAQPFTDLIPRGMDLSVTTRNRFKISQEVFLK